MAPMLVPNSRILRVLTAVVLTFLLLLLTHLANSFGFPRTRMSSHSVAMAPSKVPGLTSRIAIETRTATSIVLGGAIATKSTPTMTGLTEILGGTSLPGGTKTRPNGTGIIILGGTL